MTETVTASPSGSLVKTLKVYGTEPLNKLTESDEDEIREEQY